jgi:hypothetical protein
MSRTLLEGGVVDLTVLAKAFCVDPIKAGKPSLRSVQGDESSLFEFLLSSYMPSSRAGTRIIKPKIDMNHAGFQ